MQDIFLCELVIVLLFFIARFYSMIVDEMDPFWRKRVISFKTTVFMPARESLSLCVCLQNMKDEIQ